MFSPGGVTPQVGGVLAGLGTAFSNVKNTAIARCMTYVQKKSWKVTQKQETESSSNTTDSTASTEQLYTRLIDELGLANLPADWQASIGLPLNFQPQTTHQDSKNHWLVSHVSCNSFFENKNGFSHSNLPKTNHNRLRSSIFSSFSRLPWKHTSTSCMVPNRSVHSAISPKRIEMLEERANNEESNPKAQADYLRVMVAEDPAYVIRRYESGKYASDESVKREYLKALVLADRVSHSELDKLNNFSSGFPGTNSAQKLIPDNGTEDKPVHVILQSQKGTFFKEQLWNTVRFLIGLFLILSVIEAQLQMKMTSNQKEIQPDNVDRKFRFQDVQGVDEAKEELQEVVEFLRNPDKFKTLGGKLPTGVLLIGPPGTGKTLLAKAVAGEAGVPFFFCSGSEFDEMFVGVGAARVRNLFTAAREHAPCIVFVDELDAIGGSRVVHDHQPYSRMTLNQLLVELDGFETSEGIVVIGATNFPEVLDKALVRPGRFDTKITVPMPDVRARLNILKVHLKNVTVSDEVDVEVLARGTTGFSGADLANLVNQAAVKAATEGAPSVNNPHLEFAKDKIIMGPERKSAVISDENRKMVAYHEGGHALVAYFTEGSIPLHKATIMPRGQALGMVTQLPEKDELQYTKKQLLARLDVSMAGRVAEEVIFGKENITTGASSDFEIATKIATAMVTQYGMSEKAGYRQIREGEPLSPQTKSLVEEEIKRLLSEAYDRAKHILNSKAKEHKRLAEALLQYETLNAHEITQVVQGQPIIRTL